MRLDPDVEAALRQGRRQILDAHGDDPNVTGAGVGLRFRGGQCTGEAVVTVMVAKKRPEALVSRARLLPKTVEVNGKAWGVDVVQAGPFIAHQATATDVAARDAIISHPVPRDARRAELARGTWEKLAAPAAGPLTGKVRPPLQGCSISNLEDGQAAGTLGCFVKDKGDSTICLLSCNHVIARLDQGTVNEDIIQPGGLDGGVHASNRIAGLKRWAPLLTGTTVDAATAQLDDQSGYKNEFMNDLMSPISDTHPTVGMVVAGDQYGISTFLTRMDNTLTSVNAQLLGSDPSAEVVAPEMYMNIEKVGRTTAYTSATILGLGFEIQVQISSTKIITYTDLTWAMFFSMAGDSGSVACQGGPGNLKQVEIFLALLAACDLLGAISDYYDIPLDSTNNNQLADDLRDNFLAQSMTGQLLIDATYVNSDVVLDRLKSNHKSQSNAQSHAKALYSKWHDLAASLIAAKSPTAKFTRAEWSFFISIASDLFDTSMISNKEWYATGSLATSVLSPALGKSRQQFIDYMNEHSVFEKVYNKIKAAKALKIPGPAETYSRDTR